MSGAPLTLADRVKRVIGDELGIDPAKLEDGDKLVLLGATDVKHIHIIMSVEDLIECEIDDDAAEAVKTVGQLIALAERLAAGEREIAA